MSFLSEHWGLLVLGAGVAAGLLLIVVGALRLYRAVAGLKQRVAGYQTLPIAREVQLVEARLAAAERRIATVPSLLGRSRAALVEIQAARARVLVIKTAVTTLLRLSGLLAGGR